LEEGPVEERPVEEGPVEEEPVEVEEGPVQELFKAGFPCKDFFKCKYPLLVLLTVLPVFLAIILVFLVE
jgi:hypothetical protein